MPSRVSPVDVVCAEIDDLFDSLMPADQADQADRDGAVAELSRLLNSVDTETADAVTAREASLYAFLSLGSPAEAVRKEAEEFFARVRGYRAAGHMQLHQPRQARSPRHPRHLTSCH